jgi:hypothetical protein
MVVLVLYYIIMIVKQSHFTGKTKSAIKALEGTYGCEAIGGSCGPGKSFRRFFVVGRQK